MSAIEPVIDPFEPIIGPIEAEARAVEREARAEERQGLKEEWQGYKEELQAGGMPWPFEQPAQVIGPNNLRVLIMRIEAFAEAFRTTLAPPAEAKDVKKAVKLLEELAAVLKAIEKEETKGSPTGTED